MKLVIAHLQHHKEEENDKEECLFKHHIQVIFNLNQNSKEMSLSLFL